MKMINDTDHQYELCPICGDMMGPHAPVISMSYGFIEDGDLYTEHTVVLHSECSDTSILGILLERVESTW